MRVTHLSPYVQVQLDSSVGEVVCMVVVDPVCMFLYIVCVSGWVGGGGGVYSLTLLHVQQGLRLSLHECVSV